MILLALALAASLPASAGRLSCSDAVRKAVDANVASRVASAGDEAARGRALAAAAELLPAVTGTVSQQRVFRENLAALGFGGGSLPINPLIGPFDVFDARFRLAMSVLDVPSWLRWSEARKRGRAAALEKRLASEQVAGAAALAYIEALRSREAIRSAQAGVQLAHELVTLARDRLSAGTAMGLDLTRAQTQEANETLRLLDARTAAADADLRLKRVAGLPLTEELELSDALSVAVSTPALAPEDALAQASAGRAELGVARERLAAEGLELSARRAERLPKIGVSADAGLSGNLPDAGARLTGSIGAGLSVPLFDWRLTGRAREAEAARDATVARFEDLKAAVEEDVLRAEVRLAEAAERVQTTRLAAQLAAREVELSRGRFETGVGDNLELVSAQTERARADDGLAAALAAYQAARVNLALAVGRMTDFVF